MYTECAYNDVSALISQTEQQVHMDTIMVSNDVKMIPK